MIGDTADFTRVALKLLKDLWVLLNMVGTMLFFSLLLITFSNFNNQLALSAVYDVTLLPLYQMGEFQMPFFATR